MIELQGTFRNLAKWFRLCERVVDRSPRMERNTDNSARVAGGPTSTGVLTRGQMARALREAARGETRSGGTGEGVIAAAISRVNIRKYINDKDLRTSCGGVTLAMLMAAAITVAPTAGIPRNSANVPSSGPQPAGSIPRTPSPSVGDGNSVHPYVSDVNQGQQKKMLNKITSVTAAAVVGIAATVAGAQSGAVQWRVEDGGNGHWYQCLRTTGSGEVWNVSQAAANALGGHLATLTSQQENSWIYELSVTQNAWSGRGGPLLGGYKLPNNSFRWVTDEPWSYTSWLPGEPSSGLWEPYLNFLGPQGTSSSGATWNDTDAIIVPDNSGNPTYTYIVEWEADCNNDSIVDYGQCHDGTLADYNGNNIPDCCEQGINCPVTRLVPTQFPSIQSAIDASANGDRVLVVAGTYHEQVDLRGKGIQLIGVSGAAATFIDGDNVRTVIVGNGEPANCLVTGFTIQHGRDGGYQAGGGVRLYGSNATFSYCHFVANVADAPAWWGVGAWRSQYGEPTIKNCAFTANESASSTAGIYHYLGGGIHISDCVFEDNVSASGQLIHVQTEGGSISASIDRCEFHRNIGRGSSNFTIGFWNPYSGSIACTITDCRVENPISLGVPDPNGFAVIGMGAYPQSSYNVVVQGTTACGVPQLVYTDSNSSWSDGGGNHVDLVCITDCNGDGIDDAQQIANGQLPDCNGNLRPDTCDITAGTSGDIDHNSKPDDCQTVTVPGDYSGIQAAIDAAPVDEMRIISVTAGTYAGPIAFNGKPVIVRGAGAVSTVIEGNGGQQLSVVRFPGGEPSIAALERVTVRGGSTGTPIPNSPTVLVGGGIFGLDSAASVRDCVVEQNAGGFGGGAYFLRCTGEVRGTTIRNNNASSDGGGFQSNQGSQQLTDVLIVDNTCNSRGGGMHLVQGNPTLTRVTVQNNYSNSVIGGISWYALGSATATLPVVDCAVTSNSALITQGGIGISAPSTGVPTISLQSTSVCNNTPRPNISGSWADLGGNSICDCVGDLTLDGIVNGADLGILLASWGQCTGNCGSDLNLDGMVNGADLGVLLAAWGACGQ